MSLPPERPGVAVGLIVRPWGREGALLVNPWTHDLTRFERLERVRLEGFEGRDWRVVRHRRHASGRPLLWLDGVDSISQAEPLRGRRLLVAEEAVERPAGPSYFLHELLEAEVWWGAERLGVVGDILQTGGTDVLVVRSAHDEVLIPLAEQFVVAIDVAGRRIEVSPVPGLLEVNRSGAAHAL